MTWVKQGRCYVPERQGDWMMSHAQMPVVDLLDDGVARVYFGTRDDVPHTQTTFLEMRADDRQESGAVVEVTATPSDSSGCGVSSSQC